MKNSTKIALGVCALVCVCLAGMIYSGGFDESQAANGITITYSVDSGCGSANPENPETYTSGSVVLADALPNEGYVFAGWYAKTNSYFNPYTQISDLGQYSYRGNLTLYAFWYYTIDVTYELGEGTLENAPSVITGNLLDTIGEPVSEEHKFYMWGTSFTVTSSSGIMSGSNLLTSSPTRGNLTYTALWYYNITYLVDEDVTHDNTTYLPPGYYLNLQDATRYGYSFLGWYGEDGKKITGVQDKDITLTAKWEELPHSNITYDLDGGELVGDSVDWYSEGVATILPTAKREGYYFNGWMIDGEPSKRIENISASQKGDLLLVPWWIDVGEMKGHGYVLSYTMRASQGIYYKDYTETYTSRYYEYDGGRGFFVVRTASDNSASTYWTNEGESTYEYTYLGMQTYRLNGTDYLCEVYQTGSTSSTYYEKQYIWKGWIPIYIESKTVSGWVTYTTKMTFAEEIEFDLTGTFDVCGYGDAGILVSGSGSYSIGTDVTLTADVSAGTKFRGWVSESGEILSTETVYSFTVYTDTVVYAYNDNDEDYTAIYGKPFKMPHADGVTELEWIVLYSSTGQQREYRGDIELTFSSGGSNFVTYVGVLNGETVYGFYTVVSDGFTTRIFEWSANGKAYSLELGIMYSDFMKYRESDVARKQVSAEKTLELVTSGDKYVIQIAKYIMSQTYSMNDYERLNVVLGFVDYIEYKYDSESMGQEEYFKFPVETLYDQNGDCEDTSILFCAIVSAMGYKSALLLFEGHMAASVEVLDGSVTVKNPATFVREGVTYYYCETTTTGWTVGSAPTGYTYKGQHYIYPDEEAIMPVDANYRLSDIDFDGSEAVIDRASIISADNAGNGLALRSDAVTVDLPKETIAYLKSLGTDVVFGFSSVDRNNLTQAQIDTIGGHSAYVFTLTCSDNEISDLHGKVTVTLKYGILEHVADVKVSYVAEDGTIEVMENAQYWGEDISFETTHFSVFMVEFTYNDPINLTPLYFLGAIALVGAVGLIIGVRYLRRI